MPEVCEDLLSASRLLHGALPFLPKQTSFSSSPFAIQAPIECSRLRISIGPRFAPVSVRFFHFEKDLLLCGAQRSGFSSVRTQSPSLSGVLWRAREGLLV